MEFARKQLKKYGWNEGQGLGKRTDGIAQPVKVCIKRDNGGVGLPPGEEFCSQWWSTVFDKAASNISVENSEKGVVIQTQCNGDSALGLKKRHYGRHRSSLVYGGFLQSKITTHDGKGEGHDDEVSGVTKAEEILKSRLSDQDLWVACGGRTAHKAARHGFRLSGKLKRLEDQEQSHRVVSRDGGRDTVAISDGLAGRSAEPSAGFGGCRCTEAERNKRKRKRDESGVKQQTTIHVEPVAGAREQQTSVHKQKTRQRID